MQLTIQYSGMCIEIALFKKNPDEVFAPIDVRLMCIPECKYVITNDKHSIQIIGVLETGEMLHKLLNYYIGYLRKQYKDSDHETFIKEKLRTLKFRSPEIQLHVGHNLEFIIQQ